MVTEEEFLKWGYTTFHFTGSDNMDDLDIYSDHELTINITIPEIPSTMREYIDTVYDDQISFYLVYLRPIRTLRYAACLDNGYFIGENLANAPYHRNDFMQTYIYNDGLTSRNKGRNATVDDNHVPDCWTKTAKAATYTFKNKRLLDLIQQHFDGNGNTVNYNTELGMFRRGKKERWDSYQSRYIMPDIFTLKYTIIATPGNFNIIQFNRRDEMMNAFHFIGEEIHTIDIDTDMIIGDHDYD